ncbi:pyridoxal phosphate-dependent aminotransferase [Myxosarcina sp. GI1]|uniref:pyridoxal phosphate-dependent aminotransferase n=1 Tax=Myxosarcina sp. GI1 TaxID=1541065 RepID=UPI00056063E4|nr:pyridoxal phosphate-dependent aminotransferase [Myxosarcina sp. GI1]
MSEAKLRFNSNSRMEAVQSPLIPVIGELIRQNPGTISLGQGVVSYPPPPEAIAYIQKFLCDPLNHKYQAVEGILPLVTAIATKLKTENQIEIGQNNCVVVTAGSNMGFMNAVLAITAAGDEIILNTPYYFNHEMAITMANCQPVLVATDANYQLQPKAIAEAITDKTKAVVTISPNNPTGVVYSSSALAEVNRLCRERGIYHLSDEAYEYFTYDGVKHFSPASLANSDRHTISLFSLSKAYGFASWRIGYMVIPQHLLMAVKKVQDTNLICPPVVSQYAALGAIEAGVSYCRNYLTDIALVREQLLQKLSTISDICTVAPTAGAFYFFLKVKTKIPDLELVKQLIKNYKVAVIPGSTFGMQDGCYLRVAYGALESSTAVEAIARLVMGLRQICQ